MNISFTDMSWIKKLNILVFSGLAFGINTTAQEKLLPLSKLANCKVYDIPAQDSLKTCDAYKHPERVYAISYTFNFGRSKKENWDELPFTAKDFPNLQFLILNNFYPLPLNICEFRKLQVLFSNNSDDSRNSDTYAERLASRPKYISPEFYSLGNLKIFYTNSLAPNSYNGFPLTAFYFDVKKLEGMKSLQLMDLPDGLMDDKIIPAFFTTHLRVVVNSNNGCLFMDSFNQAVQNLEKQKLDPKISEGVIRFNKLSQDILFVNAETHGEGYFEGKDKIDLNTPVSNKSLLKKYITYLNQQSGIKNKTSVKKEYNIYNSDYFGYSVNLIELQDNELPVLDTVAFRKNDLYERHIGFVKYKVEQKTTMYYYPRTGSYILKTTYYNGLESYRVDVKWYSVMQGNKVQVKWIEETDENYEYYDYKKSDQKIKGHNYKLEEKFNREITLK